MFTSEKMVKFLREKYPPGTRIRLVSMEDPYAPVAPGTEGTLVCVDDAGQFQMKWDNGRTLALIPGEDSFTVLPPERSMLKLYMPLTAELYEPDEWGDMPEEAERLTGGELASYEDKSAAPYSKTACRRNRSEASCTGTENRTASTTRYIPLSSMWSSGMAGCGAWRSVRLAVNCRLKSLPR